MELSDSAAWIALIVLISESGEGVLSPDGETAHALEAGKRG